MTTPTAETAITQLEGYNVIKPIPVTFTQVKGGFVAKPQGIGLFAEASGATREGALEDLCDLLATQFEELDGEKPENLHPTSKYLLEQLQQYIAKK